MLLRERLKTSSTCKEADHALLERVIMQKCRIINGEVTIAYTGEESRRGARCRKYSINGAGLENRGGSIWVNKNKGYIEDMEIALPDNLNWQSFKLRLIGVERMSREK